MVEKNSQKIYSFGVSSVFCTTFLAIFFGIGSYIIFNNAQGDSLIASIIGAIISLFLFYPYYYIFKNNSKDDIFELIKSMFSRPVYVILSTMLFLFFFTTATVILYNISNFLDIGYLSSSSIGFLKALVLVPVVYISTKSLPQIIRANQIISLLNIVIVAVDIIGLYKNFNVTNLEPIFESNVNNILVAIFSYVICTILPFTLLLLSSKRRIADTKRLGSTMFKFVVITNIIQVVIILISLLVLGKEYIIMFRFPEYITLKQFSMFSILERVENILALQFFFNVQMSLGLLFYSMIKILPKNNNIKKYYGVIISILIYIITEIFFTDSLSFVSYISSYAFYVIFILAIVPVFLLFIKLKIARKSNKFV